MQKSIDRILVTHVGSLPRGGLLNELLTDEERGRPVVRDRLAREVDRRVAFVLERQRDAGVDIANDGEQGRVGFQTYVCLRMSGFGGASKRSTPRDLLDFPIFCETMLRSRVGPRSGKVFDAPQAIGELAYRDRAPIDAEVARLARLSSAVRPPFSELFMTEPSPGIVATTMQNAYYPSHESYLRAIAREIRVEYRAVVDAGFVLQIDAPDLAMERAILFQDRTEAEFLDVVEQHVAALNEALQGIPRERVRLHVCWGNWEGPHVHDVPLEPLLPRLYEAEVGGLSIELANPRHQHELAGFRRHPLPDHMILLPGVIDPKTSFVEHPELVAQRLEAAVAAVGDRERVIASADCGFGTFAGWEWVTEDVVWAKLATCRAGADLASGRLWGKARGEPRRQPDHVTARP